MRKLRKKTLKLTEYCLRKEAIVKVQGEIANANVQTVASYPEDLAKVINKAGHTKHQILNVDEAAFYW